MKEITAFRNYLNEGLDKKDDKVEENIEEMDTQVKTLMWHQTLKKVR